MNPVSDIPAWVHHACRQWGEQKRRIWSGMDWHGNVDGYAQSLMGRIREERDGASQGKRNQYWPEVFTGDGLDVQRAMTRIQERPCAALHFKYVWDPRWEISASRKARMLDVSRSVYFEIVGKGESFILRALDIGPDSQVTDRLHEIIQDALSKPLRSDTKAQAGRKPLDFTAFHRPILSRS